MAALEPIQQLHFLGDWLFKNLSRNPQMFPSCLRKGRHCRVPGSPAGLRGRPAGIKSSGRGRILTGGEIPQEHSSASFQTENI